jgi:protein-disulfide isomerase
MHKDAPLAAEAGNCAREQGKFWEYHDKLFENQRALAREQLKSYAAEIGLEAEKFNACLDEGRFKNAVLEDMRDGQQLGVTGTPAFFINGRFLSGALPYETFERVIEEELKRGETSGKSAK